MAAQFAGDFAARIAEFQIADEKRVKWMESFVTQLSAREGQYQDTSRDLESERDARRLKQQEVDNWKAKFVELQQSIERSSFVLVLVDADADSYIFKDGYFQATDGGRKAVLEIRTQVKDYLNMENPELACLPIVIKAFANEDGLSKLLVNAGIIQTSRSLLSFSKDFSQAHEAADFVLVGSGKDRADKKIISLFKQFVNNPTCRHVIFGACHDNTYVRCLEDYATNASIAERVTLLHGFQVGREFEDLQLKSIKMRALFRDKPVRNGESLDSPGKQAVFPQPEANVMNSTWAAAVGAKANGDATISTAMKQAVCVNRAGQRIDEDLPEPPQHAVESWRHKTKVANMRYCRLHHLYGSCKGGCDYSHGPLTEGENLVYRRLLRTEVCHTGLHCRDPACVYGHSCSCSKPKCKFPVEMHKFSSP